VTESEPSNAGNNPRINRRIEIIGAGVAGLCSAWLFAERDCEVTLRSASDGIDDSCCSWWAGGMLAPWCEMESTEPLIGVLGVESMEFWKRATTQVVSNGSLVIASARDTPDLVQFANRATNHQSIEGEQLAELETDLAGRFSKGLLFEQECHLDPRKGLQELVAALKQNESVTLSFSDKLDETELQATADFDWRIDCRGIAAQDELHDLRGVKGEMLLLQTSEVTLQRPVRLLHPRYPLYIVPREDNTFMVGATMIETDDRKHASARSVMELLSAAYAVHPAFAEATLLEIGTDVRPAFNDNLPRLRRRGNTLYINGLFRHGFLCAPAMAQRAVALALDNEIDREVIDENHA